MFNFFGKNQRKNRRQQGQEMERKWAWGSKMFAYYVLTQIALSLEEIRRKGGVVSEDNLINILEHNSDINRDVLEACLDFIWSTTTFIKKHENKYDLSTLKMPKYYYLIGAYRPLFDNLSNLLDGSKTYGESVVRDDYYLRRASRVSNCTANTLFTNDVYGSDIRLVDLGCGIGDVLVTFCEYDSNRRSIGFEISGDTVNEAKKRIEGKNLSKRITIVQGDVFDLKTLTSHLKNDEVILFTAIGVLHELFRDGEGAVVRYLTQLRLTFPKSILLLVEYDMPTLEEIKKEQNLEKAFYPAVYRFIHQISKQGLPQNRSTWKRILLESGWQLTKTHYIEYNFLAYECKNNQ